MGRGKFQVLVIPYKIIEESVKYCIFKRDGFWQWISGGGELPIEAAIDRRSDFVQLQSVSTIPVVGIYGFLWGPETLVVPEYCFGVQFLGEIFISEEHSEFKWVDYEGTMDLLKWDSNKNALWEINHVVTKNLEK